MRTLFISLLLLLSAATVKAQEADSLLTALTDQAPACLADSLTEAQAGTAAAGATAKGGFWRRLGKGFGRFLHNLNDFDTTYIEANHYDWTAQLQSANNYEQYVAKTSDGRKLSIRHTLAQLNLYWGYYIGKYHD